MYKDGAPTNIFACLPLHNDERQKKWSHVAINQLTLAIMINNN